MPLATLSFLVVDDSPNVGRILRVILKSFGISHVLTAASAAEAYATLRATRIDLAFVDLDLGGGDDGGLQLLRLIRTAADSPDPHLPVIVLSAYPERRRVEAARDAGATEFLTKPVSPAQVFRRIRAVVEQPRLFVRSAAYHGPDRRRRADPAYMGPERRRPVDERGDGAAPSARAG